MSLAQSTKHCLVISLTLFFVHFCMLSLSAPSRETNPTTPGASSRHTSNRKKRSAAEHREKICIAKERLGESWPAWRDIRTFGQNIAGPEKTKHQFSGRRVRMSLSTIITETPFLKNTHQHPRLTAAVSSYLLTRWWNYFHIEERARLADIWARAEPDNAYPHMVLASFLRKQNKMAQCLQEIRRVIGCHSVGWYELSPETNNLSLVFSRTHHVKRGTDLLSYDLLFVETRSLITSIPECVVSESELTSVNGISALEYQSLCLKYLDVVPHDHDHLLWFLRGAGLARYPYDVLHSRKSLWESLPREERDTLKSIADVYTNTVIKLRNCQTGDNSSKIVEDAFQRIAAIRSRIFSLLKDR